MEQPAWLRSLREAISDSIAPADLKEIMAGQVQKAKAGDRRAARFVLDQAQKLIESENRRKSVVNVTQTNFYDTPAEKRPETAETGGPGTSQRLSKMERRARVGLPLTTGADLGRPEMTEAQEKEFIRRKQDEDEARERAMRSEE